MAFRLPSRLRFAAILALAAAAAWGAARAFALGRSCRIGVAVPLSGPKAHSGLAILRALDLYVGERNAARDWFEPKLELEVRDDQNKPAVAAKAAEELASDPHILAVIGHYDDGPALAALPYYDRAGVPIFSPSISHPDFTARSKWSFSGTYSDDQQADMLAVYLSAVRKAKKVVVIATDDPNGSRLLAAFGRKAARVGLAVRSAVYEEEAALPDDFVLRKLGRPQPGIDAYVLFSHSVKGAELIQQLRRLGWKGPLFGCDRIATGLLQMLGGNESGLYVSFPFMLSLASIETDRFVTRYREKWDDDPSVYAAFAYDGLSLIDRAIRAGRHTREGLRDYLAHDCDIEKAPSGVAGPICFDGQRHVPREVVLAQARADQFEPAYVQLRPVREAHTLSILPEKVKLGEVVISDGLPYFLIRVVFAGLDVYRVNQVNIHDLNFDAELFLWFRWSGDVDVQEIGFLNQILGKGETRTELRRLSIDRPGETPVQWVSYRAKGTFVQPYDLRRFPFDSQRLPLLLAHKSKNANKIELVVDRAALSGKVLQEIYPQEWQSKGREDFSGTFQYDSNFGNPTYTPGTAQADYSIYQSNLVIHRQLFPYLVTLFLPLAILIAISMAALLVPVDQFSVRNGAAMSALVGVLVYHMAQAKSLPQVGYLTLADLYFVSAYILLFVLVFGINLVNIMHHRKEEERAGSLDRWLHWAFITGTVGAYVSITAAGYLAR